ncbi:four helix bundle protein [Dehalococcoidia bacterium]|nr:four helix bundle protein [Dehalococcoidia bacterium]MCL0093791.1 four helix bundle protein [Dehalococcoidia bacterium]
MGYRSFEELEVWKRACRSAVRVYEVLSGCKDYGLRDQMMRAAVSIASNLAEGSERNSVPDFIHIAKGSAAELRTQIYIAHKIGVLTTEVQQELVEELKQISAMLQALATSLKS